MRRTVLSATALACMAVLAGTAPAFADDPTPVPSVNEATTAPSAAPSAVPSLVPSAVPSPEPTKVPDGDQVSVVPSGAPDTGVAAESSGPGDGLIGAGAATLLTAAGVTVVVVRRRRAATGA